MIGVSLIALVIIYGWSALGNIDWRLVRATKWTYVATLTVYGGYHFVRAAWKCDLARQQEIRQRKEEVAARDKQLNDATVRSAETYRFMEFAKDREREAIQRTLDLYQRIWTRLQSNSRELAIDLREYCELIGPMPTPPLIAGENDADLLVRQSIVGLPWMEKVRCEYNDMFAARVGGLRDDFAIGGHEDFKLDAIIAGGVAHTDRVMEIADRLMGLALRELAERQLRVMTLKHLCCD